MEVPTKFLVILITFPLIDLASSEFKVDEDEHYNPVTTTRVNESFYMNIPVYNERFKISTCNLIPPSTSYLDITDLKQNVTDARIRSIRPVEHNCGFVLDPVWKIDEGNWTLMYYLFNPNGPDFYIHVIGTLIVEDIDASEEFVRELGEKVEFHLSLRGKLNTNSSLALSTCVAIHPNGTEIPISPNAARGISRIKYKPGHDNNGFIDGFCNVLVEDISIEDNGKWTLRVTSFSGLNFKRDIILIVKVNINAVVIPNEIEVREQEEVSFRLEISKPEKTYIWDSCTVKAPNGTRNHLNGAALEGSTNSALIEYAGGGLQNGDCGAIFKRITRDMAGKWIFMARISGSEEVITAATMLHIRDEEEIFKHTDVYGKIGKASELTCGPMSALQCVLVSPTGERRDFDGPCKLNITVSYRYVGQWNCTALLPSSASEEFFTTSLKTDGPIDMELETKEYHSEVNLICKRRRSQNYCDHKPKACIMERPNGERILLREGVTSTGDMQSYKMTGGGMKQCDCSMSIQTPLIKKDYGLWRCIMKYADHVAGGFITVKRAGGSTDSIKEPIAKVQRHPDNGIVQSGDPISIECLANRPLDYCRLRSPSGKIYLYNSFLLETQESFVSFGGFGLSLGECVFQFESANTQMHSGKWTIEVGLMKNNSTILEQKIEVVFTVTDPTLSAKKSIVKASPGDSALLECVISAGEKQLDLCIFQMPNGTALHVTQDSKNGRITQHGAGLTRGECGIKINPVFDEDFGRWTCRVQLRDDDRRTQSAFILLRHQTLSLSSATASPGATTGPPAKKRKNRPPKTPATLGVLTDT